MSKRLSSYAVLYAAALLLSFMFGLYRFNIVLARPLPEENNPSEWRTDALYVVDSALERSDGADGELVLQGKLCPPLDMCLYLPSTQSCKLYLNGCEYIPSALEESFRLDMSGGEEYDIRIVYPEKHDPSFRNPLIYLTSHSRADRLIKTGAYQRFLVIGISVALLIYSLSLYSGKRSEKYLLLLVFLIYTTLARTLWNAIPLLKHNPVTNLLLIGTIDFPGLDAAADYNIMFLVIKLMIAVLRFELISEFLINQDRSRRCIKLCLISAAVVLCFCIAGKGYYPTQFWILAMHGMELYLLTSGDKTYSGECFVLLAAWALTLAVRLYVLGSVAGYIPHGYIDAAVKPQGIIETFYLLSFVVVINMKFAYKFEEADKLSHSLEEVNQHLEHIVDERTAELSDTCDRLRLVQEQKSEFMANIVHNLKSPLFSLYGYTDMALDSLEDDPEYTRRCLQEINENAEYARALIEKLFLCMRLETSSVHFNKIPFTAKQLLEQIKSTSLPNAEAKNIRLVTEQGAGEMLFNADLLYIRQAMQNIVDNAIRHSPEGATVKISAAIDGENIKLSVEDEGEGMTEEQQKLIFDRYYSHSKSGATSSGLGLTIAMEIVSQHGGTISVESRPGIGSRFDVYLKNKAKPI